MKFGQARGFTLLLLLLLLFLRTSNASRPEPLLQFIDLVCHIDRLCNSETTMELVDSFHVDLKHKLINFWVFPFQLRVLRVWRFVGTMITLLFIRIEVVGLRDPNKTELLFLAFTTIEFAEGVGFHELVDAGRLIPCPWALVVI